MKSRPDSRQAASLVTPIDLRLNPPTTLCDRGETIAGLALSRVEREDTIMLSVRILAAAAALALLAGAASAQTVGIATGPQATPTNATGSAIAKVVNEASGLQTRAVPHTSVDVAMPALNRAQSDFGIASIDLADTAFRGVEQFDGRKLGNIRVVARLFPLNVGIVVRKDSSIRTGAGLKGKRYPSEFTAQKGVVKVSAALLANAGLTYKDVVGVPVPNTSRGNEDFIQGKSDSAMLALGAARLKQTDAQVGGIRILPIDTSPAGMERMKKIMPHAYAYQLKAGALSGADAETPIMAYDLLLVAAAQTKDDIVYQAVKAMHQGKSKLVAVTPVFRDFEAAKMHTHYQGLQYHPGAVKYYQEAGVALSN
ncbi:MAG: TAXI family TRAP transporter solute-binding subunit [Rhizobiales bacterium]|nr:TAXI family TRAP transporter solute-binding subunit [Hyphomicrobiales bacterium]